MIGAAQGVDGPALVWFEIAEEQNVFRMMPAGKGLSDLIEKRREGRRVSRDHEFNGAAARTDPRRPLAPPPRASQAAANAPSRPGGDRPQQARRPEPRLEPDVSPNFNIDRWRSRRPTSPTSAA